MEYAEDDYLMISGIQHFSFCKRQWALIHIETQWQDNLRTTEGNIIHERCHDETMGEKRHDLIITRGMRVFSRQLGITGQCDVVEFRQVEKGAILENYNGYWLPCPIEYKRGKSKTINADRLQLCCQAMCLEEMLATPIEFGYMYYAETHRREKTDFTDELRDCVKGMVREMHLYFQKGYTPKVKIRVGCKSCSLKEVCLPLLATHQNVNRYYDRYLQENANETIT